MHRNAKLECLSTRVFWRFPRPFAGAGPLNANLSVPDVLVRLNTDGSLDNSFGSGGIFAFNPAGFPAGFFALAIQSDGKVVAAGAGGFANLIAAYPAITTVGLAIRSREESPDCLPLVRVPSLRRRPRSVWPVTAAPACSTRRLRGRLRVSRRDCRVNGEKRVHPWWWIRAAVRGDPKAAPTTVYLTNT